MDNVPILTDSSTKTPVSMDNPLFSLYLSTKTPLFMDNVPVLNDLSIKTPLFMDNRTCFLFPSIKKPLSVDNVPILTDSSTKTPASVDNPPQIICRLSAEGSSDSCALLFCQTASTQGRRNP